MNSDSCFQKNAGGGYACVSKPLSVAYGESHKRMHQKCACRWSEGDEWLNSRQDDRRGGNRQRNDLIVSFIDDSLATRVALEKEIAPHFFE